MSSLSHKIVVRKLNKTFGNRIVLKNINFSLEHTKSLAIIGGSGSGKSVLLKCIAGLLLPDKGSEVIIDGVPLADIPIHARSRFLETFAMLFQNNALFDSMLIWENITFGLLQSGRIESKEAKKLAIKKLQNVGLSEDVAKLYPSEISGGMQKRVAIARAIATNPQLLFLDEPTSGLDPITARKIIKLLFDLKNQFKITTVTITHDIRCTQILADEVAAINEGTVVWRGTIKELYETDHIYIKEFLDDDFRKHQ